MDKHDCIWKDMWHDFKANLVEKDCMDPYCWGVLEAVEKHYGEGERGKQSTERMKKQYGKA